MMFLLSEVAILLQMFFFTKWRYIRLRETQEISCHYWIVSFLVFSIRISSMLPLSSSQCPEPGTILMEALGNFLKVGTSRSQFQNESRAFALCILWRILHSGRNYHPSKWHSMVLDSQVLGLKFSVLTTSIYANTLKSLRISGEVRLFYELSLSFSFSALIYDIFMYICVDLYAYNIYVCICMCTYC